MYKNLISESKVFMLRKSVPISFEIMLNSNSYLLHGQVKDLYKDKKCLELVSGIEIMLTITTLG